jgi:hypothetical protein
VLQSSFNFHHRINTILAGASGAKSLGSEGDRGDQVTRNNLIGAHAGAFERASVNELRNLLVEFKFLWCRANGAAAATPSERLMSKRALNGLPAGPCPPLG